MNTIPSKRRQPSLAAAALAAATALVLAFTPTASADEPDHPMLALDYDAVGTTHIGASVNASMPVGPTVLHSVLDPMNGEIVDGSMDIPDQVMEFSVFGIQVRSTVTLTQVGPLTGQLVNTTLGEADLTSHAAYDIQLSDVKAKVFGIWWPLAVGSRCHTAEPVQITTSTPEDGTFTVLGGGPLEGTYTIGAFTGCTPLNFFDIPGFFPWFGSIPINQLVSGSDNTIELNIDNPRPTS